MTLPTHKLRRLPRDVHFGLAVLAGPVVWSVIAWQGQRTPAWPEDWTTYLLIVLLYPVVEEIIFRGFLQEWLWRRTRGRLLLGPLSVANIMAATAFAAAHLVVHAPTHALAVLLPGLVFGFFRDRYGSILPGALLHCFYNAGWFLLAAN